MTENTIKIEQECKVVGITARTSNLKEAQGAGIIAQLWQRFFSENSVAHIPHKIDSTVLVCYYDFESDKDGQYSVLIGARVDSSAFDDILPAGMVSLVVPGGKQAVFLTEDGPIHKEVFRTWQEIWALEDCGELNRTYKVDYEIYDERSINPENAEVEIRIGIN